MAAFTYIHNDVTYLFPRDELLLILNNWDNYKTADNLPKWLVESGEVTSFGQAKKFIALRSSEL